MPTAHAHAQLLMPLLQPPPRNPEQALTTSVAVWYGLETFRLRSREDEVVGQQAPPQLPGAVPPQPGQDMNMGMGIGWFQQAQQQGQQPFGGMPQQQGQPMSMNDYLGGAYMPPQAGPGPMQAGAPGMQQGAAFLPPAREQSYPWGAAAAAPAQAPMAAEPVASAGLPMMTGAEESGAGRWGVAPTVAGSLPGPSSPQYYDAYGAPAAGAPPYQQQPDSAAGYYPDPR